MLDGCGVGKYPAGLDSVPVFSGGTGSTSISISSTSTGSCTGFGKHCACRFEIFRRRYTVFGAVNEFPEYLSEIFLCIVCHSECRAGGVVRNEIISGSFGYAVGNQASITVSSGHSSKSV